MEVLGTPLRVSGEVTGTASIASSIAFVDREQLARLLHAASVVNYLFVRLMPGQGARDVAERISRTVPGVTATTRAGFAASERRVVGDMSTDIVRGMTLAGFIVGVAVAALVAYGSALAQARDFAVLRAIGLRGRDAIRLVVAQIVVVVAGGAVFSLALLAALAAILPRLSPSLVLAIRPADVALAIVLASGVAILAALLPVLRIARLDPASVYREAAT